MIRTSKVKEVIKLKYYIINTRKIPSLETIRIYKITNIMSVRNELLSKYDSLRSNLLKLSHVLNYLI